MEDRERLLISLRNSLDLFTKIYETVNGTVFKYDSFRGFFTQKTTLCITSSFYYNEQPEIMLTRDDIVNAILEVQQETDTLLEYYKSF